MEMDNKEELAILEEFQKNASSIQKKLEKYLIRDFNCFDVLRISEAEIRHSNVLAFLLDCHESHKLNENFIKEFFKLFNLENNAKVMNYNNFKVIREFPTDKKKYIDILLKNDDEKIVVVIENKINSSDFEKQLSSYREFVEKEFKGYSKAHLYLTLNGKSPNDSDEENYWTIISHEDTSKIIKRIISKETINNKVKLFLEDYIEVIRRLTMKDQELIDLCNKIYAENKIAMDLIYENKDNSYVKNIVDKYLKDKKRKKEIIYPHNNRIDLAFRTADLEKYVNDNVKGVKDYYYAIEITNSEIAVYLYFIPEKEIYNFKEKYFVKYLNNRRFKNKMETEYNFSNLKCYYCSIGKLEIKELNFNNLLEDEEKICTFLDKILNKLIV